MNLIRKRLKIAALGLFLIAAVVGIPVVARADMGPKPQITVKVLNPPEGEYYLDLLTMDAHSYKNIEDPSSYDQTMIALLMNYKEEGWVPGLTMGTTAPMWGDLVGEPTRDGMEHTFGYMGVPNDFKIILVTSDGRVTVTEELHREALQSTLTYDYKTGKIKMEQPVFSYIKQYVSTCLPTLVIEGMVLLLFGFSLRQNLFVFLATNLITQLFLTLTIGSVFVKEGLLSACIVFFPAELGILMFEAVVYCFLLKGYTRLRRILYAVVANVFSAVIGIVIMSFQYV